MNPYERRRIAWGPDPDSRLDPFVVDVFGQVFNADKDDRKTALTQHMAAIAWNRTGRGLWYAVDPSKKKGRGPRRPHVKATDLIRTGRDAVSYAKWLHTVKASIIPETVYPRPGEVPLAGDPSTGWFELETDRFVSVFHGPSVAAWLFGETQVDPGPFERLWTPQDDDNSST